jgi:phage-related protein
MYASVNFDNFNTWDDFSLIRATKSISSPEPKYIKVEIEGSDGELDLTEYFGDVKYKNRKISFEFSTLRPKVEFPELFSTIQDSLHGRRMKIVLEEDSDFYYVGRVTVDEWKSNKNIGLITIDCDCEPYKYKARPTVRTLTLTGTRTQYVLSNMRKQVVPTFTINAPTTIEFNNSTFAIGTTGMSQQTFTIPEITLNKGNNIVYLTGTGTVKIEYQEGGL